MVKNAISKKCLSFSPTDDIIKLQNPTSFYLSKVGLFNRYSTLVQCLKICPDDLAEIG
jgi:hypothetical protein